MAAKGIQERSMWTAALAFLLAGSGFVDGAVADPPPELARAEPGRLFPGGLLPGSVDMTVELVDDAAENERIPLGNGGFRWEKPAYFRSTRAVVLVADAQQALKLE